MTQEEGCEWEDPILLEGQVKARARQGLLDLAAWRSLDLTDSGFSGLVVGESILQWMEMRIRGEEMTEN